MNDPHLIVLFGTTGDLARRKLLPGIMHLLQSRLGAGVPHHRRLLDDFDDDDFCDFTEKACREFSTRPTADELWKGFAPKLSYVNVKAGPEALAKATADLEAELAGNTKRLSVPPKAALNVVHTLAAADLVERSRIIMEKPFGTDLASAMRIDVPETLSVSGRSGFYEGTGAFKDMVVTHLFQVMAFMAMEPPTALDSDSISEEKNKVFRSMLPRDPQYVVRGQYAGYRDEEGVSGEPETETFVALRAETDNWQWAGVPFLLRTGKQLAEGARIISIAFREPPKSMFPSARAWG